MAGLSCPMIWGENVKAKAKVLAVAVLLLLLLVGCGHQGKYVGSVNSDKYHKPSCEWAQKILPKNEVWFDTAEQARQAGYKPCKTCRP